MFQQVCHFDINIPQWKIVCNKVLSPEDWRSSISHWVKSSALWPDFSPKLEFLSPLKRRRLSESARLFFAAAWELTERQSDLPVVYASFNGEINRNFSLWLSLLEDNEISPTSFSLSVHNALVGQWSELRRVKNEVTALTARCDNLEIALMEAYLMLQERYDKVLVVVAESPLKLEYNAYPVIRQPFSYALALIVEQGDQYRLTCCTEKCADSQIDNALTWVRNQYATVNRWSTPSSAGGHWLWQKN
ncbi:beta-ketoacyl synthase chain length factor [Bisgaard Taxon 10/6]|uniref:beta-ketoacyl synthase chain length factor n=1 Tax=Exercitatus varius TaxID=67857 RepID=UPI00294B6C66|nr:beta-ketoacyl synthase chain length factor [Exercitatus varius]MDG2961306.1 beta-ketoacyl synthase chain length factor [Exercitatus varius]